MSHPWLFAFCFVALVASFPSTDVAAQTTGTPAQAIPVPSIVVATGAGKSVHTDPSTAGKFAKALSPEFLEWTETPAVPWSINQGSPPSLGLLWDLRTVPAWATVSKIEVATVVNTDKVGDFRVYLSGEASLAASTEFGLFLRTGHEAEVTDNGRDDDPEDDTDIDIRWREVTNFNGQPVAQVWGLAFLDATAGTLGNVSMVGFRIYHQDVCTAISDIPTGECNALHEFHHLMGGDEWTTATNWLTSANACSWYGVTCGGGHVTGLTLSENNLVGALSPGLGALSTLTTLDLRGNQITGTLPDDLGSIASLGVIELSSNQISGALPSAYGALTQLTFFSAWSNQLTGSIPAAWSSWSSITLIQLGANNLSGTLPSFLGSLGTLDNLYLAGNAFTGAIPESFGGSGLTALELHQNLLEGAVPLGVAQLCATLGLACNLTSNATLCIPDRPDYAAIGVNPIGGLSLSGACGNRAPVAVNDAATTGFNMAVNIPVLANDSDPDGDPLAVSGIAQAPAHGTATVNAGSLTVQYTPAAGYSGADSFHYSISDSRGGAATATVNVTVSPAANLPPVAADDAATTAFNTASDILVLANDSDPDSDPITVTAISQAPGHGSAAINAGGASVRYSPTAGYSGADTFRYTISDGRGGTSSATVSITVSAAANRAPVAADDAATTAFNTAVDILVRANDSDPDSDPITVSAIPQAPGHGTVAITAGAVAVRYTPTTGYSGADTFRYTISDGRGGTASATVSVTVSPAVNRVPVAVDDIVTTAFNAATDVLVLANDSDPDSDPITVTAIAQAPAHGAVAINGAGASVRYTPTVGYSGADSFRYTISDGRGGSASATVAVTVGSQASVAGQVTFRVNMNREIRLGNLRSGRVVGLMGSVLPLTWEIMTQMADANSDGVYEVMVPFNLALGGQLQYKFVFGPVATFAWEGSVGPGEFGNRVLAYSGTATLPEVPWNNVTGVAGETQAELPTGFVLTSVYPNPFNPTARVAFEMPSDTRVRIDVTDSRGRLVATLVDGMRTAGRHEVNLDAADLPSGIYLVTLRAGSARSSRTVALVK